MGYCVLVVNHIPHSGGQGTGTGGFGEIFHERLFIAADSDVGIVTARVRSSPGRLRPELSAESALRFLLKSWSIGCGDVLRGTSKYIVVTMVGFGDSFCASGLGNGESPSADGRSILPFIRLITWRSCIGASVRGTCDPKTLVAINKTL